MTELVLQPSRPDIDLLLETLIAARGAAAPRFNLKTIRLLEGLVDGTKEIDAKTWLNLTNMVTKNLSWAGKLALQEARMPTPAEAYEQIRIKS
jgi:hypothetical protein